MQFESFHWLSHHGIRAIRIHQIFSLTRDWSKHVTWPNIPQPKLGDIHGYPPIFKTARVAKNIWKTINTIASIWGENMLGYLSLDIICSSKLTVHCSLLGFSYGPNANINRREMNSLRNIRYGPRTRLVRGIYSPVFKTARVAKKDFKDNNHNSLSLGWKYARIFVPRHYMFLEASRNR